MVKTGLSYDEAARISMATCGDDGSAADGRGDHPLGLVSGAVFRDFGRYKTCFDPGWRESRNRPGPDHARLKTRQIGARV